MFAQIRLKLEAKFGGSSWLEHFIFHLLLYSRRGSEFYLLLHFFIFNLPLLDQQIIW